MVLALRSNYSAKDPHIRINFESNNSLHLAIFILHFNIYFGSKTTTKFQKLPFDEIGVDEILEPFNVSGGHFPCVNLI